MRSPRGHIAGAIRHPFLRTGGVTPAGVENFDGSYTYDNPQVTVDGANIPIVNDGSNYNATGFCALKGKTMVSATTGASPGGNVADLSQAGQLQAVAAYSSIITSVVCTSVATSGTPTIVLTTELSLPVTSTLIIRSAMTTHKSQWTALTFLS